MIWTPKAKVTHKTGWWFALFPTRLDDGRWVWLQSYYYESTFHYARGGWNEDSDRWVTVRSLEPIKDWREG